MRAVGFHRGIPETEGAVDVISPECLIRRYCEEDRHTLIDLFGPAQGHILDSDGLSAQYDQMHMMFKQPGSRAALIIIPDSTHLADNLEELVHRLLVVESLGCEVRCTDTSLPDPLQNGREFLGLSGRPVRRLHNLRDKLVSKASRGEVLGKIPHGYRAGDNGQLVPDPDGEAVVRNIFKWYTDPSNPIGLRLIAQRLNDMGLKTRQNRLWSQVTVSGILRNRVYIGTYNRYGVRVVGNHQPLVDRETFRKAETVRSEKSPIRKPASNLPFLLSRLVVCSYCGRKMFGLTRRRTWRRASGEQQGGVYRYYECPSRSARRERKGGDVHASCRADDVERQVLKMLGEVGTEDLERFIKNARKEDESSRMLTHAENEFIRSVRYVADGYGRLEELREPLDVLLEERNASPSYDILPANIRNYFDEYSLEDNGEDLRLIAQVLVKRVVVKTNGVEIEMVEGLDALIGD